MKMIKQVRDQAPAGRHGPGRDHRRGPRAAQAIEKLPRRQRARRLGGRARSAGSSREEIREQFARADIFVAPANLESFGIAALEARCAGLPVVAKARTGIREFVAHGAEGLLAESDADMVAQLSAPGARPGAAGRIARHNRETPSSVDWSRVVDLNVAAYRQAVAG